MNPQWHDEFLALCAIYPSGELTEEEWALLQVHLAYCDACRQAFEEHQDLMKEVVPSLAFAATDSSATDLLSQQQTRQVETYRGSPRTSSSTQRRVWMGAVAAGIVSLVGFAGYRFGADRISTSGNAVAPSQPAIVRPIEPHVDPALAAARDEIAALKAKLEATDAQSRGARGSLVNAEEQLKTEQTKRDAIVLERDQLRDQLAMMQTEVASLQTKANAVTSDATERTTRAAALEARVHELNASVEEKDRMLALDKEFLAHDREVRDLIGARDLYIADIYDVGQNGKTSKPFGRIFYTKAKSLVFYGYDLDKQAGLKQSVSFQVWGSGDDRQDVSLGIFYQDESHKHWVLRFNDSKTLAHLNRVFVTAEPEGGSHKPTGKPLLLAYLQMQANHP